MRPAVHPDTLQDLIEARNALDCQLQLALFRAGIMAPADLDRVRVLLGHTQTEVWSELDQNGQRRLRFVCDGTLTGVLNNDGAILHFTTIERADPAYVASHDANAVS